MNIRRCLSVSTLCILAWLSAGCPPPGGGNPPSPPSLITVVQLGTNPADTTQGGIDLNLADVSRSGFPSGLKIRLIATALDNASGIASLTLDSGPDDLAKSKLGWQCAIRRGSEIIGTPEEAPLAFSPPIPAWAMVEARSTFEVISELLQRTALALSQNQKPSYSTITTSAPIEPFQQNLAQPPKPSRGR